MFNMKKLVKESLILESPDHIVGPDGKYYTVIGPLSKTYAFEIIINQRTGEIADVLISDKPNEFHGRDDITNGPFYGDANYTTIGYNRPEKYKFDWKKVYPGRLFMEPKVITFWNYPDEKEMKEIINIIEKKMKIQLIDNGWTIEVYKEGMDYKGQQTYSGNYDRDSENKEFVPIEQFIGSKRPPEKEKLQHLDTKHKHEVPKGFGSKSPEYLKKRQWQMATAGEESKKEDSNPQLFEEDIKKAEEHIKKDIEYSGLNKKVIKIVKDSGGAEVKICAVNADYVRDTDPGLGFNEFVDGGHHYVTSYKKYKMIPEDEIWIDDVFELKPNDFKAILLHEYIERNLMKYKKWTYSAAHEYANKKEADYRKRVKK